MAETTLREKIVVDGAEAATAKLNVMAVAAGRVAGAFSGLGDAAGALGGIAGIWQVAEAIRDVDHLYAAVNRVVNMTGMAADHAHAMFDMFELSGVEMESAERIMTSMTRSAEKMSDGFGGVGAQAQMIQGLIRSVGVSIKAGPEERLFAMSKAAQAGKLNIDELIRAFMIPRSQASAMMSMLKAGPEHLKGIQAETLKGADVIDDRALQSYRTMLQARRELKDAWGDLVGVFYKNLLPAVTSILQGIKKGFDDVMPIADKIGKVLSKHMDLVVKLTKTYLELLIAAKAINLFSGAENQMGVLGRGKQLATGAFGLLGKRAAAAGSIDYFAAREAAAAPSMFSGLGGLLSRVGIGGARAAGSGIGMFESVGGPLIRIIGTVAGRLGIIGAIITVCVVAFEMLKNNTWGIASAFKKVLSGVWSAFSSALTSIVQVLGVLWAAIKPIVMIVAGALLIGLLGLAKVVEFVGIILKGIMDGLVAIVNAIIWLLNKIPGVSIDMIGAAADAQKAAESKSAENKAGAGTYQDFRGSKFEISNNFPTGIDGGRVAVAFGDELAKLGERRLDSGLRPLFSYR